MLVTAAIGADPTDDQRDRYRQALIEVAVDLLGIAPEQIHVTISEATAAARQQAERQAAIAAAAKTGC
ncbi:hypothetical protein [Nonomuraea sp. NPDC049400]|uniref:hypothetical protein n=1 Tax=Nonomuraea sp. NPDC049400 TaxID=3364352 RepID=UPI0037993497